MVRGVEMGYEKYSRKKGEKYIWDKNKVVIEMEKWKEELSGYNIIKC